MKRREFFGSVASLALPSVPLMSAAAGLGNALENGNLTQPLFVELDSRLEGCFSALPAAQCASSANPLSLSWIERSRGENWSGESIQQHARFSDSVEARVGTALGLDVDLEGTAMSLLSPTSPINGIDIGVDRSYLFVNEKKVSREHWSSHGLAGASKLGSRFILYIDNSAHSPLNDWMLPLLIDCGSVSKDVASDVGTTASFIHGALSNVIAGDFSRFDLRQAHCGTRSCDFDALFDATSDVAGIYASTGAWQSYLASHDAPLEVRINTFAVPIQRLLNISQPVVPVKDRLQIGRSALAMDELHIGDASVLISIASRLRSATQQRYEQSAVRGMNNLDEQPGAQMAGRDVCRRWSGDPSLPYFFTALQGRLDKMNAGEAVVYAIAAANYSFPSRFH